LQRNNTCPVCRAKIEWRHDFDFDEQMTAIINAIDARNRQRQALEDNIAQLRQALDNVNERIQQIQQQTMTLQGHAN
jgi:prefoldin subunit 5